jgi:hypothetical protein
MYETPLMDFYVSLTFRTHLIRAKSYSLHTILKGKHVYQENSFTTNLINKI